MQPSEVNDYSSRNERLSLDAQKVLLLTLMLGSGCISIQAFDNWQKLLSLFFIPICAMGVWHIVRTLAYKKLVEGRYIARLFIVCYVIAMGLVFVNGYTALVVGFIPFICLWGIE